MRLAHALFCAPLLLAGCGGSDPHPYPEAAQTSFHQTCPASAPECVCTWEAITRAMPVEEFDDAIATFEAQGVMDTRITRARTKCREKHARG